MGNMMIITRRGRMWHILTAAGKTIGFAGTLELAKAKAEHYARTSP